MKLYPYINELFIPFKEFPWFKDAPIGKILNVEEPTPGHFYSKMKTWFQDGSEIFGLAVNLCREIFTVSQKVKFPEFQFLNLLKLQLVKIYFCAFCAFLRLYQYWSTGMLARPGATHI